MPRTLLISRENGDDLKTYGVKKVRTTMKFPFIIGIGLVFLWCFIKGADSKILNERQYLEYLNDLDRRNVEFDDIHEQWPFVNRAPLTPPRTSLVIGTDPLEEGANRDMVAESILSRKFSNSKNNKNFLDRLLHLGDGFQHMRDAADRADQIAQYRRQPLDPEYPPVRIYPEPVEEEETKYHQDEKAYGDDVNSEREDEELSELRLHHHSPILTSFPRIVIENIYDQKFGNPYTTDDTEGGDEEEIIQDEDLEERMPIPKPTFSPSFFPRVVTPDFPFKFNFEDFLGSKEKDKHEMHHGHDDYTFKEGEQFPQTIDFDKVPVVENPNEFAVKPADPRFYREIVQTDDAITMKPMHIPVHSYILDTPSVISKPKMNSRSDLHQQESLPDEELQLESFVNKDVQMVPFKPNSEEDTAGVYIIAIVAGISAAATVGLTAVAIGWYNLQKHMKNAEDTDYPSYGIVGPNKDYEKKERNEAGDRKLAQSAQMYHYQHQKQQIIAMGRNNQGHGSQSESEEEEDEEGNYTVYECPGLASIEGPLEVKNPMFDDDQLATPSQMPLKMTNKQDSK